jgi:hypothetical protein
MYFRKSPSWKGGIVETIRRASDKYVAGWRNQPPLACVEYRVGRAYIAVRAPVRPSRATLPSQREKGEEVA